MSFLSLVEAWANALWNPWLLSLFLLVGGWFTLRSGFFQFAPHRWAGTLKRSLRRPASGGLTQLQALSTALASTIGTGSIAGVATAIFFGGPGAVFWMWVSALLGMMTGFVEKYLAAAYRETGPDGSARGGPMCYMARGLKRIGKPLAAAFSLACVFAALAGGAMVQANSISTALHAAAGVAPLLSGTLTALAVGLVLLGGIGRVGKVSETLVPLMAGLFLAGGTTALFLRREALPAVFATIWQGAFRPQAAFGGYTAALALRYGVARGVFTNEAGLGSSAMAHAAAGGSTPNQEGCWGMVEVLISTLVVCTVTALVILTAGVYAPADALSAITDNAIPAEYLGAPLCAASFGVTLGKLGPVLVSVSLLLFAYTSLLGWGYYGERALSHLWGGSKAVLLFRGAFLACVVLGSVGDVGAVWQLADLSNGLMALPNLTALLLLSPQALSSLPKRQKSDGSLSKSPGKILQFVNLRCKIDSISFHKGGDPMTRDEAFEFLDRTARGIAEMFGSSCETLVQDMSDPSHPILTIYNGQVSGREVGSTADIMGSTRLIDETAMNTDFVNLYATTPSGAQIKSSTFHMIGEGYNLALGIDFDYSSLVFANRILVDLMSADADLQSALWQGGDNGLAQIFDECLAAIGKPVNALTKTDRTKIVALLDQKNAFSYRKSVPYVAKRLQVSRYTVYKYLDQLGAQPEEES